MNKREWKMSSPCNNGRGRKFLNNNEPHSKLVGLDLTLELPHQESIIVQIILNLAHGIFSTMELCKCQ